MSTLEAAARTAATDAVADLVDAVGAGRLRIYTAGFSTLLVDVELPATAFLPSVAGVASLSAAVLGVPVVASGDAATYRLTDSTGAVVLSGTVGTSTEDLLFLSVTWTAGELIDIATLTITTPAS